MSEQAVCNKLTEKEIEFYLAQYFGIRRNIIVPNVSWGLISWGEADLLIMTPKGYLTEIEIKTSVADLRNDKTKKRWEPFWRSKFDEIISQYFVALPPEIYEKTDKDKDFQDCAGIITIHPEEQYSFNKIKHERPSKQKRGRPLSDGEQYTLMRLGCMRYWSNHKHKNGSTW